MGRVSSPELAAAVSRAGGLGMVTLARGFMPDQAIVAICERLRDETGGLFGVNCLIPVADRELVELVAPQVRVVDFFWGNPDPELVKAAHEHGALVSWQVGSRQEAGAAQAAGCDFVIAQGTDAGGHIRGKLGVLPLLSEVLPEINVPVLAAGGIGSPRALAAVLAAGAAGVRIGTLFAAAAESGAHPDYVAALVRAEAEDSVHTSAFHVECPLCPSTHGVLRSALVAAEALEGGLVGQWSTPQGVRDVPKFFGLPPSRDTTGRIEAMALYAGQSVGGIREVKPAAEIVRELVEGAELLLSRWAPVVSVP